MSTVYVPEIEGYLTHTGDWWPVEEGYGYWLEGDVPARYAVGPEESVWIVFDDDGDPWEYMDDEW